MEQLQSPAITAILLLACLVTAALAQSTAQTPQDYGQNPLNYLKPCQEEEEDMLLAIQNTEILVKIYSVSPDELHRDLYTQEWNYYKQRLETLLERHRVVCDRRQRLEEMQVNLERLPKPSPSPSPSAQPSPQPSPPQQDDVTKSQSEQERKEKLVKDQEEYEKQTTVAREEFTRLIDEIHAAVRKIKVERGGKPRGYEGVPETRTGGALRTSVFSLPEGQLRINLSQDIRAGDTISGTVVAEPNGRTEDERARNLAELTLYQLDVRSLNTPEAIAGFSYQLLLSGRNNRFTFKLPPRFPGSTGSQPAIDCTLTAPDGNELARVSIPLESGSPTPATDAGSPNFQLSTIGQQGRNNLIRGKFDGNAANTYVRLGDRFLHPLVESPRECIFEGPSDPTGMSELEVRDGSSRSRGQYRNLGLQLSAPKTSLLQGETTLLTVTVRGLKGITRNVPLLLQKQGVVNMEGGDTQTVQIRPADVRADGTFELKRTLTGLQAGAFGVTATVIDPAHRPIVIPLAENAKVNGFRVKKEGNSFVIYVENVQSPITGDPVDGEHKLEHKCPTLSKIPYLSRLFLNKGDGKMKAECLIMITPRIIIQDEN